MAARSTMPAISPEGSLSLYLDQIRKVPMREPEQEYMLAKRWTEHEDMNAAHKMVTSHLRLVAKIAMGYRGYGLPVQELSSEGNVGMMQAVKRFDPERGFRLATYAMWWIRAAIQEYILHSWSLVKMGTTAAQKKLFFNLRRIKGEIEAIDDGDIDPWEVAAFVRDGLGLAKTVDLDPEIVTVSEGIEIDVSGIKGSLIFEGWANGSAGVGGYPEWRRTEVVLPK